MSTLARLARSRWLVQAATFALIILGTAAVAVAVTLALTNSADNTSGPSGSGSTGAGALPSGASATSPSAQIPTLSGDQPAGPVAELADAAWVTTTATATGIPERALAAYAGAALAVERSHPGCGLGWNTLAAIGLVESEHGTLDGATLDGAGNVAPPIIGVALDGSSNHGGVAKVPDTDKGELDDDTTWDRAGGPMQFIPATWTAHAVDGNSDGTADIHNIDDAALSAATYLCATGGNLTQPDDWIAAISAYNPDTHYNNKIADAANTYAAKGGQ